MRNPVDSGICQSRRGLLFLRDCGNPAIAMCNQCGRPVCAQHQIMDGLATICPECRAQKDDSDQDTGIEESTGPATRDNYYERFDYVPIGYGSTHYFSDRDYRTVDTGGQPPGTPTGRRSGPAEDEAGGPPEGDDDLSHFTES